jgi:hypothetical protein
VVLDLAADKGACGSVAPRHEAAPPVWPGPSPGKQAIRPGKDRHRRRVGQRNNFDTSSSKELDGQRLQKAVIRQESEIDASVRRRLADLPASWTC